MTDIHEALGVMDMFTQTARELFTKAGADPDKYPDRVAQCTSLLSRKMAILSATMGLSYERVTQYSEQKDSLVEDIKGLMASGDL